MQHFEGRVAVITGAASGIGAALARACAERGMALALCDIEGDRLQEVAEALRAGGGRVLARELDVTDADALEAFAAETYQQLGGCHLLCNNAGVMVAGNLKDRSLEDWEFVMGVNVRGVIHGVHCFLPRMLEAGDEGHIVNMCSSTSLLVLPCNGVYQTSKFAVLGLTESLHVDLEDTAIGASAVCPGSVETQITRSFRNRPAHLGKGTRPKASDLARITGASDEPNRTTISPRRVAQLILEAVERDELYVITHPGSKPTVEQRLRALWDAYDAALRRDGLEVAAS